MNLVDADALKEAVPENVKQTMSAEELNALIAKEAAKTPPKNAMAPDEFASHTFIEKLPSKYLKYPEGTKLYGRPLNIRELKKLSSLTMDNATTVIDDVLKSSIKGIAFEDILISDKLYLILWLRANTYPESGYSVPFICSECENESTYDFKVDDIDINYIKEDEKFEDPVEMTNKDFIVFKYPTVKDEQRKFRFRESLKKSFAKYDDDTMSMAITIDTVNGKPMSMMAACDYISNIKIYSQIKGHIKAFDFGISNQLTVKCNHCGGTAQAGLTFREDFFIPVYRAEKHS